MKVKLGLCIVLLTPSIGLALTPISEKNVPIDRSEELVREAPDWFQPRDLLDAPDDIDHRMKVLPYKEDRYSSDEYIVVPTLGLVAPVQFGGSDDQQLFLSGEEVNIDPYLRNGIMYYHGTAELGEKGNAVYFGHSNYLATDIGRYKTIFGNIMALDKEVDELWFYRKNSDSQEYERYTYVVSESFETDPTNVSILLPQGGKETTLIACTDGLNGRWIIKGAYKPSHYSPMSNQRFLQSEEIISQLSSSSPQKKKDLFKTYLRQRTDRTQTTLHKHYNVLSQNYMTQMIVEEIYVRKNTGQYN